MIRNPSVLSVGVQNNQAKNYQQPKLFPKFERKQYSPQYQFKPGNSASAKKSFGPSASPQNLKNVEIELRFSIKSK